MTEPRSGGGGGGGGDRPEIGELLSGLDPPRSLPESLRRRLEDGLTTSASAGAGAPARPLDPELNERLTAALESREDRDMVILFSGLDGPRPLPAGTSERLRALMVGEPAPRPGWVAALVRSGARARIGAGVAAACLLVAAVTGIALTRHNPSRPAATKSSSTRAPVFSSSGSGTSSGGAVAGNSGAGGATAGSGGQAAPQALNAAAGATGGASQGSSSAAAGGSGSATSPPAAYSSATPTAPSTSAPSLVPQVAGVNPARGSATGGTTVTIRGLNFEDATSVHFGTMAALNFAVTANGQITAIAPPHLPGFVNITVTTAHGTSAITKNDRYDYTP